MTSTFIPFGPTSVLPASVSPAAFQPTGPASTVSESPAPVISPEPLEPQPQMASSACLPNLTVQRDGERITSIHVKCSCGEIIEVACEY